MLGEALSYLRRGLSVIPVSSTSKMALVRWAEYQTRTPSEEEVREWFESNPDASIGIVTGAISGLVVLDIDHRSGDVDGKLREILSESPTGLIARTGSGGYHLYYRHDFSTPVGNVVGRRTGVDCRGEGGMVLAPPSHHASGNDYAWHREGWDDIGTFSTDLYDRLMLDNRQTSSLSPAGPDGWITDVLRGVGSGGRNDSCAKLAGYYYKKKMPKDVAVEMLLHWNERNSPPLSESEVRKTVDSVYRTALRREESITPSPRSLLSTAVDESPLALDTFEEYMLKFGQEAVRWQIPGWLPEATIAMVVAPPGSYKTWLLTDLAVSVASGRPFLNRFAISNPGPVLFVQQEDFHGQLAERFAVIAATRFGMDFTSSDGDDQFEASSTPSTLPIFIHPDRKFRFGDAVVMEALEEHVARIRPRMMILDPLYSTGDTDDYLTKTVQYMFDFKRMRDEYGTSFIIAHHTKKARSGGLAREDAWGSQFLNAFLETGWQIRQNDGGDVFIRRHFKVGGDVAEQRIAFDIDTLSPPRYEVTLEEADPASLPTADKRGKKKAEPKMSKEAEEMLHFLSGNRGVPMTKEEIAAAMDLQIDVVMSTLKSISIHLAHRLDGRVLLSDPDT